MPDQSLDIRTNVPLAPLTTIQLGGEARYFATCHTTEDLREGFEYAKRQGLRVHLLGGGSNTLFSDQGFDGLVLQVDLRGVTGTDRGRAVELTAAAGEPWDALVQECVRNGYGGLECLSGIPGLAGATPIQNVGAYGQEVRETIVRVRALDRATLREVQFTADKCMFGYRTSRFKQDATDRFVILAVTFMLQKVARPTVRYAELKQALESRFDLPALGAGAPALTAVRETVLALRKQKSMVVDPADSNSRSLGSFFMNPVVDPETFGEVQRRWNAMGGADTVPAFPAGAHVKIPAAWLVERAGFPKGFRQGGVGVSMNHSLALVNLGGTTKDLLALADAIQNAVQEMFGIRLQREPVFIPST